MNAKKTLMYAGLCLTVLTCAVGVRAALAVTQTATITMNVLNPDPDVVVSGLTWTSGTFLAINSKTTSATATVDPTGTVTAVPGTPGNARLVGSDTVGSPLDVQIGLVSAGQANTSMNLTIRDSTTHTATVNLVDGVSGDAPFTVNAWTAGTATTGTMGTFSGTTGLGTITLDAAGTFENKFGATLSTVKDALPKPYSSGAYTGTVEVLVSY